MGFDDTGLAAAMGASYTERLAKEAKAKADSVDERLNRIEWKMDRLADAITTLIRMHLKEPEQEN
jgi:hypothetical protein